MASFGNYVPDLNRFRLSGPPEWFQRQLYEFDPSLVIIPSRMGFYYRLAQRRKLKLPEKIVNDVMKEQADTQMLASYGLVPVTTILATVNWSNPIFFLELQRRAPWRMGGADKFTAAIEGQERQEKLEQAIKQDDELTYRSKESWRLYNKILGTRSHIFDVGKTKTPTSNAPSLRFPKPAYRPELQSGWGNVLRNPRRPKTLI